MPTDGWRQVPLGETVTFQRGFDLAKDDMTDGPIPVISSGGVMGCHSRAMARGPGVVIGRTGTLDSVYYVETSYWPHNTTLWVKDFHGNVPKFVYYFLKGLSVGYMNVGSANPTLNRNHLHQIAVALPGVGEQRAIASVLGSLDDKIELNRRMNQTLEQIAQALFKSWFVDFDPVRARADGRWKKGESLPGMPADMWDLWPSEFEESEIGEIPKGWGAGTLGDLTTMNPESWTAATRPGTIRYVDLASTKLGRIETVSVFSARDGPSRAQRVLRRGDTILGTVRPGNKAYALISEDGLTGSTGFAVLRPKRPGLNEFVYLAATSRENIEDLASLADGSAYPAVSSETVGSSPVVLPPEGVVTRYSAYVQPLFAMVANRASQSGILAHLRDTLLPKLLAGEIRVPLNGGN
jgi:type I restriction enzyme, S subunit